MPYYRDLQNKVHFLDKAECAALLPSGCVQITNAEAIVLQAPTPQEVADRAAAAAAAAETLANKQAAQADAVVQFLATKSPAEVYAKVQADITDLATAKVMVGKLAVAVSVLARSGLQ